MSKNEDWMDETFDQLRSRGASCSQSFSNELEERMMKERLNVPSRNRSMNWVIAMVLLTVGIAGGAYASSAAIKQWMFGPFHLDSDGTIRNTEGDVVGETRKREDGTLDFSVDVGESRIVVEGADLPEGPFSFSFEASENESKSGSAPEVDSQVEKPNSPKK